MEYRPLHVASPIERGPDVRSLQRAINRHLKRLGFSDRIDADGQFGPQTFEAAKLVGFALGARKRKLRPKAVLLESVILLIVGERKPTRVERNAATYRKRRVAAYRAKHNNGAARAVKAGLSQRGVTERGYNNRGPQVDVYQRFATGTVGYPWCGAFTYWCSKARSFARRLVGSRAVYTPSIAADGHAKRNGFIGSRPARASKMGDWAVFHFGSGGAKHVGLVVQVKARTIICIEGNTSPSNAGSQANGGGVYLRERPHSHVLTCAIPDYARS